MYYLQYYSSDYFLRQITESYFYPKESINTGWSLKKEALPKMAFACFMGANILCAKEIDKTKTAGTELLFLRFVENLKKRVRNYVDVP